MFLSSGRRLFQGKDIRFGRRLFTSGGPGTPKSSSGYFDDRTLGLLALLVSVPTAAYIWKHHKSTNKQDTKILKELAEVSLEKIPVYKKRKVKYLIVGGGAAGFSAIQAIKEADPEAQIVLVSKEAAVPYLRPPLSKELWFTESGRVRLEANPEKLSFTDWHGNSKPIAFESESFYKNNGVEMILGCEAISFDLENREIGLSDGQILGFDRLLIATGAEPKALDVPIDEAVKSRVCTFRNISDFAKLHNELSEKRGKRIVVIGGGFLGSELAVSVSKLGKEMDHTVTQVFPEDGHMGLVFPKYLSRWTSEKVSQLGVNIKPNRSVRSIEGADGDGAIKLILDNGEVEADQVIVAVGVDPSITKSFKSSLPIDKEFGGLEADKFLQVAPGVFAAGDVVSYVDPVLNCRRRTEHFDHAVLSGKLAGLNMTKSDSLEPYSNQSMFWSDLGPEVGYEAVGLVDSSLTTVGVWARAHPTESPKGTELDATDIRVQPIGKTSISTVEPLEVSEDSEIKTEPISAGPTEIEKEISQNVPEIKTESISPEKAEISPSYGKGVVFYLKDRKIVGILLFNLFNRVNLAKEILKEGRGVDDVSKCVRMFNVEEVA